MNKRGVSLIWAIIMSMVVFTIAVTTSNFVMKESQMSVRIDDSAQAYAAAESGIEWGKYCLEKLTTCDTAVGHIPVGSSPKAFPTAPATFHLDTATYNVTVSRNATETKIESLGTSSGVNRKLEHIFTSNLGLSDPGDVNNGFSVTGSYIQQFEYWKDPADISDVKIGLYNSSGSQKIYFEDSGVEVSRTIRLSAEGSIAGDIRSSRDSIPSGSSSIPWLDTDRNIRPYVLKVRIEYTKDLFAKMTVMYKDPSTDKLTCISPIMILDISKAFINPTTLTKFYFSAPAVADNGGDGSIYKIGTGVYFDHMMTKGISSPLVQHTLTYTTAPGGHGRVSVTESQSVSHLGTGPIVTATADAGYEFYYWMGDTSFENPRQDTNVTHDISVTAIFRIISTPPSYSLTTPVSPTGSGSVAPNGVTNYTANTNVTLTASQNTGYAFRNWTGTLGCSGTNPTLSIVMTADKTCTANFISTSWWAGKVSTVLASKYVFFQDLSTTYTWSYSNGIDWGPFTFTACTSTFCNTTSPWTDGSYSGKSTLRSPQQSGAPIFSSTNYPAQAACAAVGGRLPTMQELWAIYTDRNTTYGSNFVPEYYWSTTESVGGSAYSMYFVSGGSWDSSKDNLYRVRCVKD